VSTSVALALLVTLQPGIAQAVPGWAEIFFGSGVTIGALTAIVLNLLFFHVGNQAGPAVASIGARNLSLKDINAMDEDRFVQTFASLYPQGVTWPIRRAYAERPFTSAAELRAAFQGAVISADEQEQRELILRYHDIADLLLNEEEGSTPDDIAALTETGTLAADRMDDVDRDSLMTVSAAYQDKFGLPLLHAISATTTLDQILSDSWRRAEASPKRELRRAVGEVANIADRRFDVLVADANPIRSAWSRKFEQLD